MALKSSASHRCESRVIATPSAAFQLVHRSIRFHARIVLGNPRRTEQPGGAVVAGARVDLHRGGQCTHSAGERVNCASPARLAGGPRIRPRAREFAGSVAVRSARVNPARGAAGPLAPAPVLRDIPALPQRTPTRSHRGAMPVRDALPPVLRGEVGADLSVESRAQLESLAHDAQTEKRLAWAREELGGRLKQPDPSWGVYYLLAGCARWRGNVERATQSLLQVGEKVAAKKKWEPLAAIAERSLALSQTHAAARLLVQAHEGLKRDPSASMRSRARGRSTPTTSSWRCCSRSGWARPTTATTGARCSPSWRRGSRPRPRWSGLEEAALEFVEHADWDGLAQLAQALPRWRRRARFRRRASSRKITAQAWRRPGAPARCWSRCGAWSRSCWPAATRRRRTTSVWR